MREILQIETNDIQSFKYKLVQWANDNFSQLAYLDSNHYTNQNNFIPQKNGIESLIGIGEIDHFSDPQSNFDGLYEFHKKNKDWLLGYVSYDIKNKLETLESNNIDHLGFPEIHFFIPKYLFIEKEDVLELHYPAFLPVEDINNIIKEINEIEVSHSSNNSISISNRYSKEEYIDAVIKLKEHIQVGDIYEVNFCQEFYSFDKLNPLNTFKKLKELSPTPFSCFYKLNDLFLLSASPERYLKKVGNRIISQPIKGTAKRGASADEDQSIIQKLKNDPKEQAENIMIVDLVRNDLSRTAAKGSVKVDELCGIYTFPQVHQMISTISSELKDNFKFTDVLKTSFPMGSMTGAPKIRAMKLIEKYERTKRGIYSGAVGYISPNEDFDFNVVIRSITYNAQEPYISFIVGGAITQMAKPEDEYTECMVKAEAMLGVLNK